MTPEAGIVNTHAHTICPATPQRTADKRRVDPTPMIAPVIVCVVLTGTPRYVAAKIEIDCTRCLQPVAQDLKIPFDVNFVTPEYDTTGRETELNKGDLETAVFAGDQLDLTELIREQILLNLPEQVFCNPDCKGLCPKCGQNRNLINCNCEENETDPRWAVLKDLK